MLTSNLDPALATAAKFALPVAPGIPHGVALPGSQKPGYTAVYRNYKVGSKPLPTTVDPKVKIQLFVACFISRPSSHVTSS
jgi:long-chain acyl-CoA synthetase